MPGREGRRPHTVYTPLLCVMFKDPFVEMLGFTIVARLTFYTLAVVTTSTFINKNQFYSTSSPRTSSVTISNVYELNYVYNKCALVKKCDIVWTSTRSTLVESDEEHLETKPRTPARSSGQATE